MKPLAVVATGMITNVGLDAPSSCAAMRCAMDRFEETRFIDRGGEWLTGAEVFLETPLRGRAKLVQMAAAAAEECLAQQPDLAPGELPLLLCVAEEGRPGRIAAQDNTLLTEIGQRLEVRFHKDSAVIAHGRVAGVEAVRRARELVDAGRPGCLIVGVDTYLVAGTLAVYEEQLRLLSSVNSNGFIPGEAGAGVILGPADDRQGAQLVCLGLATTREEVTVDSEEPLRGDGLAAAFRAALSDAGCTFDDLDYRLVDVSGEQYGFKEATLALARTVKKPKAEFDIWHPADCIGEVGAAIVPVLLSVAHAAATKEYAPGPGVLCHCGSDDGSRGALILQYRVTGEG